ncbi:MAG: class I mannose-6-phosphate isomerase [Erysipelotrichaceae bacterium]|nr:class I mannose-6-phosphate isomerase [Erysipelotrichaceae bacterium]
MEIIKLIPACKDYLWGGTKLKTEYNKKTDLEKLAETWEISVHRDGASLVDGKDCTLNEYLDNNPGYLGTACPDGLPILAKLIDSAQSLSIQVHPGEEYAQKYENDHGKTESWFVVSSEPGSFIYFGVNREVTRVELKKAIEDNTILDYLNKIYVKPGDFILIEAGTIHAIGEGLLICEVQQNSNVTYRMYDYDRKDANGNKRQLHVDKALDVSIMKPIEGAVGTVDPEKTTPMIDCDLFTTEYFVAKGCSDSLTDETSFTGFIFLDGCGTIAFKEKCYDYRKGDTFMVPAENGVVKVTGNGKAIKIRIKQSKEAA